MFLFEFLLQIGQYIVSHGGVVTAEELAPYLDVENAERMVFFVLVVYCFVINSCICNGYPLFWSIAALVVGGEGGVESPQLVGRIKLG